MTAKFPSCSVAVRPWKRLGLWIAAVVLGTVSIAQAAGPMAVVLPKRAEVAGDRILLGDIARIPEGGRTAALVGRIDLGPAPAPARSRRIDARYVDTRLRQAGWSASAALRGAASVEVVRASVRVSKKAIAQAAAEFLRNEMPWGQEAAVIRSIRVNGDVLLPKGAVSMRVAAPEHTDLMGTVPLTVVFAVDGTVVDRTWAVADVAVVSDVVITTRPLARYQQIGSDAVRIEQRDLADLPGNVVTGTAAVVGKRVRHPLAPGTVLRADMVETPPLVNRGDVVVIVARSGGLEITARGVAREKGHRGSRIAVENVDSARRIYARVLDGTTVEVDF